MRLASFASRIGGAFGSAVAYREVARAGTGSCVAHLTLVIALVCLAEAIQMARNTEGMGPELVEPLQGIPDVHLENGELWLDPPGRFVGALEGEPFLVLDPEMSVEEVLAAEQGVFVTRTHLFVRNKNRADTRTIELAPLGDRVITEADLARWQAAITSWFPWLYLPFAIAFSLAWRLGVSAALAVLALPLARGLHAQLGYEGGFRVATLAIVPTLILGGVAGLVGRAAYWPAWAGLLCTLGLLAFGVAASRSQTLESSTLPRPLAG